MVMQQAAKQHLVWCPCSVWHQLCGLAIECPSYYPPGCSSEDLLAACAQWLQVHREAVHLCVLQCS